MAEPAHVLPVHVNRGIKPLPLPLPLWFNPSDVKEGRKGMPCPLQPELAS